MLGEKSVSAGSALASCIDSLVIEAKQSEDVTFVMYFYEAHLLSDAPIEGDNVGQNKYDAFESVLSFPTQYPFFIITYRGTLVSDFFREYLSRTSLVSSSAKVLLVKH